MPRPILEVTYTPGSPNLIKVAEPKTVASTSSFGSSVLTLAFVFYTFVFVEMFPILIYFSVFQKLFLFCHFSSHNRVLCALCASAIRLCCFKCVVLNEMKHLNFNSHFKNK